VRDLIDRIFVKSREFTSIHQNSVLLFLGITCEFISIHLEIRDFRFDGKVSREFTEIRRVCVQNKAKRI